MGYSASNKRHIHRQAVNTIDATVTTIKTIPINILSCVRIWVEATASRTGGSGGSAGDSAGFVVTATAKNVAGTAAIVGSETTVASSTDISGAAVHITVTSGTAIVTVTGAANNNVTWNAEIRVEENI